MGGQMHRKKGGYIKGWLDRQMDNRGMGGWTDGRINGCVSKWINLAG